MGRKTKLGKTRKDKFYKLAKETGYRSRAAFKLIQLNRKFGFLQESQVCIDLCAAPGGWMQVAKQNMPISSIVIGVDLFPIKPVGGCIGLIGDITTDACRTALAKELGTWKADVVLHDGAPNVGKNWLHDAFQQITLTLSSLKLATQFLRHGGWFVTKVFRSKDYNALLWVLKQLFRKVHATKPSASRKESAEIFVVCEKYIAPDKIDPRLLDPRYVFEELELETKTRSVLHPEKQRKVKAEGYTEKDFSLRHELPVSQFIEHPNGIVALQGVGEIVFDDEEIACHAKTTTEIRECCKDIKVLGRKDVKVLIAWWRALHREWEERQKPPEEVQQTSAGVEKTQEELEDEELDEIEAHVAEVALEEAKDAKRRKKKASKLRTRLNEKMNLKMVLKGDEGPREEADDEVFTLKNISSARHLEELEDQTPDLLADSDNEPDSEFRPKFVKFARDSAYVDDDGNILEGEVSDFELSDDEAQEEASDLDEEGLGLSAGDDDSGNEADVARAKEVQAKLRATNPLLQDLDYRDRDTKRRQRVQFWYEKDNLKALDDDVDEEHDLDRIAAEFQKKGVQILGKADPEGDRVLGKKARKRAKYAKEEDADTTDTEVDEPAATSGTQNSYKVVEKIGGKAGFDVVKPQKKKVRLSEEELALGSLMAGSKRKRRDLVDAAWNRYAFGDEDLPEWFVRDEQMHMRKEAPVPKELVGEYRKRMEEINVRPIKKVMEAKARKKKRALKRLTKAKKKAEAVLENPDASSQEKIRQIRKLYKKAEDKKKDVTYVVSRKAFAGKKARRPPGVKGRYRIVDLRQKKDKRATTAREKRQGKRRK